MLSYIKDNALVERSAQVGAELHEQAQRLLDLDIVGDVRGRGMLLGVELVKNKETREAFPRSEQLCETVTDLAFTNGLLATQIRGLADGVDGDAVILKPPITTPREDVMAMLDILESSLREVQQRVLP